MFDLVTLGLLLIFMGFGVVVVAMILSMKPGSEEKRVRGGGVVMIGPIPLIFGSDMKWASVAIALALILIILSLVVYVI